jgi:hypothetical protein
VKLIITLILFIPNLLWSDHKNSDDLSGINLLCGDRYLVQFINNISDDKNIEKKTKIEKPLPPSGVNSNVVHVYDLNYAKENREDIIEYYSFAIDFLIETNAKSYMTDLEFILIANDLILNNFSNSFIDSDYNSHSIKQLLKNKNFSYLINRQKLSLKLIKENFEVKCKKIDTSASNIYKTILFEEIKEIKDEYLLEKKQLKDEQKI